MKKIYAYTGKLCLLLCTFLFFSFVSDNDFMSKASQANLAEVSAAKLALTKSASTEVKNFAKQMITDHMTAQKELVMLAKKKGVSLPLEPDAEHKSMKEQMMNLSGSSFDSMYLKAQVTDHQAAIALFTDENSNGTDMDVKSFAAKYLPKLKGHLSMIPGNNSLMHMGTRMKMGMDSTGMSADSSRMSMDTTK